MVRSAKQLYASTEPVNQPLRAKWAERIDEGLKRYQVFRKDGTEVVDRYRLERTNQNTFWRDKYNILYSSTETMKPSLYAQTPKVQAVNRHKDRNNPTVTLATMLMESAAQYAMEEVDFDDVLNNVVEDYLLPGLGIAWVRYEPKFETRGAGDDAYEALTLEGLGLDYVHWKDFISCDNAVWQLKKWIARRVYFNRKEATARFGATKAKRLQYSFRPADNDNGRERVTDLHGGLAIIWEIWDKVNGKVIWYSEDYPGDVLDEKDDPLRLKDFFPCPRPLRAISTTSTFVPRAFYSEYRSQAETLDNITQRIRILTQALRVVGVYDASQPELNKILSGIENKMVAVENWTVFSTQGGLNGAVQYLPIKDIATVLSELYKQREIAKNEIYEITGFSDIVRGVSKASETLGAQEIKNNWATGRLRLAQKEVQRFCRDIIRIMSEIISEHFTDESLALYAGFDPPPITPEEQQAAAQYAVQKMQYDQAGGITLGQPAPQPPPPTEQQQAIQTFKEVVELLRKEKTRCALIGIETDSTIQPDEAQERKDRLEFLGQIGAFLQQAGPMALQYPDMRGLLGAIMMFVIRTFRASRPLEKEFEQFSEQLAKQPPMPPPGSEGQGKQGKAPEEIQAEMQLAQMEAQAAQQAAQLQADVKRYEIDKKDAFERDKLAQEAQLKLHELGIRERELAIREQEIILKGREMERQEDRADEELEHQKNVDNEAADQAIRELEQSAKETKGED